MVDFHPRRSWIIRCTRGRICETRNSTQVRSVFAKGTEQTRLIRVLYYLYVYGCKNNCLFKLNKFF